MKSGWELFIKTGLPEAYLLIAGRRRLKRDVFENQRIGLKGDQDKGCR
jgi:hypothetical protein